MLTWIVSNLSTIVICAVLIAAVILIVLNMRKSRKKGKSSCGCSCSSCPMAGECHCGATIPPKSKQKI